MINFAKPIYKADKASIIRIRTTILLHISVHVRHVMYGVYNLFGEDSSPLDVVDQYQQHSRIIGGNLNSVLEQTYE